MSKMLITRKTPKLEDFPILTAEMKKESKDLDMIQELIITPIHRNNPPIIKLKISQTSKTHPGTFYTSYAYFDKSEVKEIIDVLRQIYNEMEG